MVQKILEIYRNCSTARLMAEEINARPQFIAPQEANALKGQGRVEPFQSCRSKS